MLIFSKNNLASHLFLVILGLSSNNAFSTKKVIDNKDVSQEKKNSQKKGLMKRKLSKSLEKLQEKAGNAGVFSTYSFPAMKKKEVNKKEYSLNTFFMYKPTNNQQPLQSKIQDGSSQTNEITNKANVDVNFENFVKNYQVWIQQQLQKNTQHNHVEVFIVTESLEDLLKKDQN